MESLEPIGRFAEIEWVDETGSTNADLVDRVRDGLRTPVARFTDLQTAGRGRRDRRWDMEPGGGLLVSFFVPWDVRDTIHRVPSALGVAAVEAISRHGRTTWLKWPNDLVAGDDAKVAGMLSEVVAPEGTVAGVVCGFGCNVSWHPVDSPRAATSLDQLGDEPVDRRSLGASLCAAFDAELDRMTAEDPAVLQRRYRERCSTIGRRVRIEQADGAVFGIATDVDVDGRLLLDLDGHQRAFDVGDVVHLRPGDA